MKRTIEWLLEGEPFVEYRTRIDLLGQLESDPAVSGSRRRMVSQPGIQSILQELKGWSGGVLSSHKSAGQPFHKLSFIADLGLTQRDPGIREIVRKVLEHPSDEGPFQLQINVPRHFGGSGSNEWAWALCDAPVIVYALAKFGLKENGQVQKAAKHLAGLARENGWPCAVSKGLGRFRGPGRKDDPCPYATLVMLKMLAQFDQWKDGSEAHAGAESLLGLWEKSLEVHPYMFYMGTDFRKMKAPFVWYDILHVLEALSQFSWLRSDSRMIEMLDVVKSKADDGGRYTPESEWKAWKGWEFGQKRQPSRWLTLLVLRILRRVECTCFP